MRSLIVWICALLVVSKGVCGSPTSTEEEEGKYNFHEFIYRYNIIWMVLDCIKDVGYINMMFSTFDMHKLKV